MYFRFVLHMHRAGPNSFNFPWSLHFTEMHSFQLISKWLKWMRSGLEQFEMEPLPPSRFHSDILHQEWQRQVSSYWLFMLNHSECSKMWYVLLYTCLDIVTFIEKSWICFVTHNLSHYQWNNNFFCHDSRLHNSRPRHQSVISKSS